jgi:hypothetical protein
MRPFRVLAQAFPAGDLAEPLPSGEASQPETVPVLELQ